MNVYVSDYGDIHLSDCVGQIREMTKDRRTREGKRRDRMEARLESAMDNLAYVAFSLGVEPKDLFNK